MRTLCGFPPHCGLCSTLCLSVEATPKGETQTVAGHPPAAMTRGRASSLAGFHRAAGCGPLCLSVKASPKDETQIVAGASSRLRLSLATLKLCAGFHCTRAVKPSASRARTHCRRRMHDLISLTRPGNHRKLCLGHLANCKTLHCISFLLTFVILHQLVGQRRSFKIAIDYQRSGFCGSE